MEIQEDIEKELHPEGPEYNLFIIWSKGRYREQDILADIRAHMEIVYTGEMAFDRYPPDWYRRFYGSYLPNEWRKARSCGSGEFRLIVVRQPHPVYAMRTTLIGRRVPYNVEMMELKEKYRQWTNKQHKIHGTLRQKEFRRDIERLTGHTAEEWERGIPPEPFHFKLPEPEWPEKRLGVFASRFHALRYRIVRLFERTRIG